MTPFSVDLEAFDRSIQALSNVCRDAVDQPFSQRVWAGMRRELERVVLNKEMLHLSGWVAPDETVIIDTSETSYGGEDNINSTNSFIPPKEFRSEVKRTLLDAAQEMSQESAV